MRAVLIVVVSLVFGCSKPEAASDAAPGSSAAPSSAVASSAPADSSTTDEPAASAGAADAAAPEESDASTPDGSALIGGAGVAGGAIANASTVVAGLRKKFRDCYRQGLRTNLEMQGSVALTLKVSADGTVTGVGGGGGRDLGPIIACLKAAASTAQFSPPQGGGAIVTVPITFKR